MCGRVQGVALRVSGLDCRVCGVECNLNISSAGIERELPRDQAMLDHPPVPPARPPSPPPVPHLDGPFFYGLLGVYILVEGGEGDGGLHPPRLLHLFEVCVCGFCARVDLLKLINIKHL